MGITAENLMTILTIIANLLMKETNKHQIIAYMKANMCIAWRVDVDTRLSFTNPTEVHHM
jgi:hypothetical protein